SFAEKAVITQLAIASDRRRRTSPGSATPSNVLSSDTMAGWRRTFDGSKTGRFPNSAGELRGTARTSFPPRICRKQESPIAITCQRNALSPSVWKRAPTKEAYEPALAFSSAYHESFLFSHLRWALCPKH